MPRKEQRREKSEEKKQIASEDDTLHSNPGNYCAKDKRKKQGLVPNPAALDHLVTSYDLHGSYGGPILNPPRPQWENIYIYIYNLFITREHTPDTAWSGRVNTKERNKN